jgi:hypothetical protein
VASVVRGRCLACQDKKQGVTCGDDGRVFAVALCCGAEEDGSCRWDVLFCAVIRRRTLGGEKGKGKSRGRDQGTAGARDPHQNSCGDRHTKRLLGMVRWLQVM